MCKKKRQKENKKIKRKNRLSNSLLGSSQTNTEMKIKHTNIYKNFHIM